MIDEKFPTSRLSEIESTTLDVFRLNSNGAQGALLELGNGIPIWGLAGLQTLHTSDVRRIEAPLATFRERWLHPIRGNGRGLGYAESTIQDGRLDVPSIALNRLCEEIDRALAGVADDVTIRIILAPEFHLDAIWLRREDPQQSEVHITPQSWRPREKVNEEEFLLWIRQQTPVGGVYDARLAN